MSTTKKPGNLNQEEIPPPPSVTGNGQPDSFIVFGYRAAILLAFLGIILSSIYLFIFINKSNPAEIKFDTETAYNTERKTVLLSTAIFVAMSFGFLGFGLFLINAKGDVDGGATFGTNVKINFTKLSPGLFVILCATVIIIFAITHNIEYTANIPRNVSGAVTPDSVPKNVTDTSKNRNGQAYQRNGGTKGKQGLKKGSAKVKK
jgi:hypothetical protein